MALYFIKQRLLLIIFISYRRQSFIRLIYPTNNIDLFDLDNSRGRHLPSITLSRMSWFAFKRGYKPHFENNFQNYAGIYSYYGPFHARKSLDRSTGGKIAYVQLVHRK